MSLVRVISLILLSGSILILGLIYLNRYAAAHGGHDLTVLYPLATVLGALVVGLWFRWKPAAMLFLFLTVGTSLWLGIGTVLTVPIEYWHYNLFVALLLLLPVGVVVRNWSQLR